MRVYCDDPAPLYDLLGARCEIVVLPEIMTLGVKRAKFSAYRHAVADGGFIYLDADIIVLESLSPLTRIEALAACPDDLSACAIPDRAHPWPGDPALEARRYVNGGVLVFPSDAADFIDLAAARAADDRFWSRYIYPDALYDNHVLCALLNLEDVDLVLLDATEYNWPGLRYGPSLSLQVRRSGGHLVNVRTGRRLRIAHFTGIHDVDAYLASLPLEISSLIHARSMRDVPTSVTRAAQVFEAVLDRTAGEHTADPTDMVACEVLHREATAIAERLVDGSPPPAMRHVSDHEALLWVTYE